MTTRVEALSEQGRKLGPGTVGLRSALLWDLDNVTTRADLLPELAEALTRLVGPRGPWVAAAHRRAYRIHGGTLREHGIEVVSGGRRRAGADRQLIAHAHQLRRQGVQRFVLASHDGDFVGLAGLGELHIATLDPSQVSGKLVQVAEHIHVVRLRHADGEASHR